MSEENKSVHLTWVFKLTFLAVLTITFLSFMMPVVLFPFLFPDSLSEVERNALNICDVGLKGGIGALGGLLTGKLV